MITGARARFGESMPAWRVTALGEPMAVMTVEDVPVPVPGEGEVLIDMWSAALNFADSLLVRGRNPGSQHPGSQHPVPPFTPGLELCGEVADVGPGVERTQIGRRVVAVTRFPHGALARFAVAAADDAFPAPTRLDDGQAAAFHLSYQTAWFGLYHRVGLRAGETVLVFAAAGGVGTAAVQLAKAAGARVIAVVGTGAKVPVARLMGADLVLDRESDDVVAAVTEYTGGRGVDVVVDPVGGAAFTAATTVIGFEGRILLVGFASGQVPQAVLDHALAKNYSLVGVNWGLYRGRRTELVARANIELNRLAEAGVLEPYVGERLAFAAAASGLARLADGVTVGRVVVFPPN